MIGSWVEGLPRRAYEWERRMADLALAGTYLDGRPSGAAVPVMIDSEV